MKKTYKMRDLDCANCAAKMETAINKLPEVEKATVSFFAQKMTVEFAEGTDEAALVKKIKAAVHKVEPDCEVLA